MNKISSDIKKWLTPGTPVCCALYALLGVVIAVLLPTIGFWKTLFIFAFAIVGGLIGGIGNKQEVVRAAVNRRFPDRNVPIRDKNLERTETVEAVEKAVMTEANEEEETEDKQE